MVKETEYYELLGAAPDASPADIRRAYRRAALKCHPDRGGDTAEFQRLQHAYATLYDAEKRRVYDEFGAAGAADTVDVDEKRFASTLSEQDIVNFLATYRYSDMEREDVVEFFERFRGDVTRVVEYIPYAEYADLMRFVAMFDTCDTSDADVKRAYERARRTLVRRAAKVPQRDETNQDAAGQPAGAESRASAAGGDDDGGMAALVAQMRSRNAAREDAFNGFIGGLERKYSQKGKKSKSAKNAKNAKGATSSGRVAKRRRGGSSK